MPETPDFDQIASLIVNDPAFSQHAALIIAIKLCAVWNARGAADIAKLDGALSQMMGATASGPYVKNLDRALRTLDR